MTIQVATGFVILSGSERLVTRLSVESLRESFALKGNDCLSTVVPPTEKPGHAILGIQFLTSGGESKLTVQNGSLVLLFGELFGRAGQSSEEALSLHEASALLSNDHRNNCLVSPVDYDGDCSIGLVCARTGRISAFNDNQGFRRVFYYHDSEIFIVGTRLPAILQLLKKEWRISRAGARIYLTSREARWPLSIVDDVKTLPPMHRITEVNGSFETASYWMPVEMTPPKDRSETAKIIKDEIKRVILRKVRGARGALALSGGYDSTSLARIAAEIHEPITAVCMGYLVEQKRSDYHVYDETAYAESIAKSQGLPFLSCIFGLDDVREAMAILPSYIDQPGQDPTSFFMLSRFLAQKGYEVLISGIGGDACFAQKSHFPLYAMAALNVLRHIPGCSMAARAVSASFKRRGGFGLLGAYFDGKPPESFLEWLERSSVGAQTTLYKNLLGDEIIAEINQLTHSRAAAFTDAMLRASSPHEWRFLFSIWANPCEYHVDISASYLGLRNCMPFLVKSITNTLLSQGAYQPLQNREFEAEIFDPLPFSLMLKRKSGFTLPYDRWCRELMSDDVHEIVADQSWERLGVNLKELRAIEERLNNVKNSKDVLIDLGLARFLSRLVMLKRFASVNKLSV